MPFTSVSAGAPSVFVDSQSALTDAYATLSTTPGGGTIYLTGNYSADAEIHLNGGGSNSVHITSANPNDAVEISRIYLNNVDNVRVSNMHVDGSGVDRPDFHRDLDLQSSSRIEIADSVFSSNGSIMFDPSGVGVLGERLGMIRNSEDITVEGNYFERYEQGLTVQETSNFHFANNEVTLMQGDGLRLVGVEDVLVEDNYFHDFAATPNEFTHSDFIQLWSSNAITESRDITVTGNVLDTGNGVSVQGIWMRNEQNDHGNPEYVYENITVTNNLIYTGSANGIGIGVANNVLVEGNTLLWNQDAVTIKADGDTSYFPRIRLDEDITNGRVARNITTRILHGPGTVLEDNILISWRPERANFAGTHFPDIIGGGDIGPAGGLQLSATSPFVGIGADASQPGAALPVSRPPPPEPVPN